MRARHAPALALAIALAIALAGVAPVAVSAQEPDPHAAQPERPTVATHAYTVFPGYAELEAGLELDHLGDQRAFLTPLTFKVGLARRLQVEATTAWVDEWDGRTVEGMGDLILAVKWRIADSLPVLGAFAVQPEVRLPSGTPVIGANAVVGSLLLISSQHFGPAEIDINVGWLERLSPGGDLPRTAMLWTVSGGSPVTGRLGWTFEVFGFPGTTGASGTAPLVALLIGPTWTVREWCVIDAGVIVPIAGPQAHSLYAGLTWNFGRLWGRPAGATAPSPSP